MTFNTLGGSHRPCILRGPKLETALGGGNFNCDSQIKVEVYKEIVSTAYKSIECDLNLA